MKNLMSTIFYILFKIIKIGAIVFIILFVSFVGIQRLSNNKISIFGYRMFSVVSESMAPTYVVGDILITKNVSYDDLKVGDDVSYEGLKGSYQEKVITHKIISKSTVDGKKMLRTKGVNNLVSDPEIEYSQVYGKVVSHPIILSKINKSIQTSEGFYLFIFIPLGIIIGSEIIESSIEKYKEKHNVKK